MKIRAERTLIILVIILSGLILMLCGCAGQQRTWTEKDTAWEATYQALAAVDWSQSLYTADHPDKYRETNPALGAHPSRSTVNAYFAGTAVAHAAVSYALPDKWRPYWQYVTIGLEANALRSNVDLGIGLGLPW